MTSIATVLAAYHPDVATQVTEPVNGISSMARFKIVPPNSGEVKEFCEQIRERQRIVDELRAKAEARGDVVVLPSASNYQSLMAQAAKPNNGAMFWEKPWIDPEGILWMPKDFSL